jgi:hypothetical protein
MDSIGDVYMPDQESANDSALVGQATKSRVNPSTGQKEIVTSEPLYARRINRAQFQNTSGISEIIQEPMRSYGAASTDVDTNNAVNMADATAPASLWCI